MRVVVALEPWPSIAEDGERLGRDHFEEVDGGIEHRRIYGLDAVALGQAARGGSFIVISARVGGTLVGYLTWTLQRDPEAVAFWADQGAWYVAAGYPSVALKLWRRSLAELKLRGVQVVTPHHRQQGRGKGIGKFFERQGAVHVKSVYQLWIGE